MNVIHQRYIVYPPTYWIPSLSFNVNRPFHSRYTAFFTLKIQGKLSHGPWLRSKFKVTKKVPLLPTHIPFVPWQPIPGIQLIQILTLKLQGQVHSWRLHRVSNITSTHVPFIPCRSALPFLRYGYLKQGKSEGFESCDRPIVRKRPIWVKIGDALSRVTMKFDRWP